MGFDEALDDWLGLLGVGETIICKGQALVFYKSHSVGGDELGWVGCLGSGDGQGQLAVRVGRGFQRFGFHMDHLLSIGMVYRDGGTLGGYNIRQRNFPTPQIMGAGGYKFDRFFELDSHFGKWQTKGTLKICGGAVRGRRPR